MWRSNLAKLREERATLSKQTVFTEAHILAVQKINDLKGELNDKEKKLSVYQSELKSLRLIKAN